MAKKLTIVDILAQKEAAKQKKAVQQTLFIASIDAEITIQEPTKALIIESAGLEDQSDNHLIYHCLVEPDIKTNHKELMSHFGCATPFEIVECLFKLGVVSEIAQKIMALAGYSSTGAGAKVVNDLKN
jgi:hypothetical protein